MPNPPQLTLADFYRAAGYHASDPVPVATIGQRGVRTRWLLLAQALPAVQKSKQACYTYPTQLAAHVTGKALKKAVLHSRLSWVDIDPPDDVKDVEAWQNETRKQLLQLRPAPRYIVDSGRGLWAFWRHATDLDVATLEAENRKRIRLAQALGIRGVDKGCFNADRLARFPLGSLNEKTGRRSSISFIEERQWREPPTKREQAAKSSQPAKSDQPDPDVKETADVVMSALDAIADQVDEYDTWLRVGMALHHWDSAVGFGLWNEWSRRGDKYPGVTEIQDKWRSFAREDDEGGKVSILTITHLAEEQGWERPDADAVRHDGHTDADGRPTTIHRTYRGWRYAMKLLGYQLRRDERSGDVHIRKLTTDGEVDKDWAAERSSLVAAGWRVLGDDEEAHIRTVIAAKFKFSKGPARFTRAMAEDFIRSWCHTHRGDLIRDWLEALPAWDGTERLPSLLADTLGAERNLLNDTAAINLLVGAVIRTYKPGALHDWVPVLVGPQGCGKGTFCQGIVPRDLPDDTHLETHIPTPHQNTSKTVLEEYSTAWLVEYSELVGVKRAEVETLKQFISRRSDKARVAYARTATAQGRMWVAVATANARPDGDILPHGPSGHHRWVPIEVGQDLEPSKQVQQVRAYLTTDTVRQLWAEALHRYRNDHTSSVLPPAVHQEHRERVKDYEFVSELDNEVEKFTHAVVSGTWKELTPFEESLPDPMPDPTTGLTALQVAQCVGEVEEEAKVGRLSKLSQSRVTTALDRCGWTKKQVRRDGTRVRAWFPPAVVSVDDTS